MLITLQTGDVALNLIFFYLSVLGESKTHKQQFTTDCCVVLRPASELEIITRLAPVMLSDKTYFPSETVCLLFFPPPTYFSFTKANNVQPLLKFELNFPIEALTTGQNVRSPKDSIGQRFFSTGTCPVTGR